MEQYMAQCVIREVLSLLTTIYYIIEPLESIII